MRTFAKVFAFFRENEFCERKLNRCEISQEKLYGKMKSAKNYIVAAATIDCAHKKYVKISAQRAHHY